MTSSGILHFKTSNSSNSNFEPTSARLLLRGVSVLGLVSLVIFSSGKAYAQATPNLVSACSGVSLPPSALTGILTPVVNGIVTPVQNSLNPLLGAVNGAIPLLGLPSLSIDAAGILSNAASGAPITLQVLNTNGLVVGPTDQCDSQADSFTLKTPKGISIGGNRITGLGTTGLEASAGEFGSVALGNSATTDASALNSVAIGPGAGVGVGAVGSVAIGSGAQVTVGNSVALGQGSAASRGANASYTAIGLALPQASAGEVSVGTVGGERQVTNVAAGSLATDAVNVGQLTGVAGQITALSNLAVLYDSSLKNSITLGGVGGTTIGNLAPGTLGVTSMEAVNGSQLFATNTNVTTNTTAIANLIVNIGNGGIGTVQYSNPGTPTVPNGGVPTNDLTLVGLAAAPVALHNVAPGVVAAGSTDAVNGGQLFAVQGQITTATANSVSYDNSTHNTITLSGAGGTTITNVMAGALTTTSTDAVNGAQLNATNTNVTNTMTAVTNLQNTVTNGGIGPVQYSNAATPTTPNGGTASNDLTLVGANAAAPVVLHNVASGVINAVSTDAVNGSQVYALNANAVNAVTYNTDALGNRTNTVTLAGGNAAAPVVVNNIAPANLSATSTDAVNGSQLYATNQAVSAVEGTANTALTLSQNSVQYDADHSSVTLNPTGTPSTIHNVASGVAPTDAVNVMQLGSAVSTAVTTSNAYTDAKIAALNFDLRSVRREANSGTAAALAAAGLPQAYEAGKGMIAIGGGAYLNGTAVSFGFSKAFNDGHTVVKLGGTYDSSRNAGASGGIGYQF
jgi:autotransporter adhesin